MNAKKQWKGTGSRKEISYSLKTDENKARHAWDPAPYSTRIIASQKKQRKEGEKVTQERKSFHTCLGVADIKYKEKRNNTNIKEKKKAIKNEHLFSSITN